MHPCPAPVQATLMPTPEAPGMREQCQVQVSGALRLPALLSTDFRAPGYIATSPCAGCIAQQQTRTPQPYILCAEGCARAWASTCEGALRAAASARSASSAAASFCGTFPGARVLSGSSGCSSLLLPSSVSSS